MAAATGSSIRYVFFAPALLLASRTALFSTSVTPLGTQIITLGLTSELPTAFFIKYFNIFSVMSKSDITPSLKGLMATIFPGVRPSIFLASSPTSRILFVLMSIATTDGSLITIPLPLI